MRKVNWIFDISPNLVHSNWSHWSDVLHRNFARALLQSSLIQQQLKRFKAIFLWERGTSKYTTRTDDNRKQQHFYNNNNNNHTLDKQSSSVELRNRTDTHTHTQWFITRVGVSEWVGVNVCKWVSEEYIPLSPINQTNFTTLKTRVSSVSDCPTKTTTITRA